MKGRLILAASSAVVLGLFVGISFSVQMTPEVILVVTIIRHIRISLPIKIPSLTLSEHLHGPAGQGSAVAVWHIPS